MHSGCVDACHSSQVESKCVTACEAAMYACIDHTGPAETPKDTDACQAKVLKQYKDSKRTKSKAFLQIRRSIDDDNAQAAEMARMEDQADKIMGEDQDDHGKSDDSEDSKEPGTDAFLQIKRNIDDDNAQAAEMARMEDQADKIMGEDQDDHGKSDDSEDSKEQSAE